MQYTRSDIMYAVNRISSHDSSPSSPDFQGIKHLVFYLAVCPHCPIIYPAGLDITTTHDLSREVSPGDFHSQNISNVLVDFSDEGEGRSPNDKCAISCVILCIFGVAVHWSAKTQPDSSYHSADSEVCTFYLATKMVQWFRPILKKLGF